MNDPYQKLLMRQLRKHQIDADEVDERWEGLLWQISQSYKHYEQEYNLIERSIDISSEELVEANRNLREQAASLRLINQDLSELAYAMSHDLKEPLRSITMHLQMISKVAPEIYNKETKEYFDYVIDSSRRMYDMLSAMLNYARINKQTYKPLLTDLNEVLQRVKANLDRQIRENGAVIHIPDKLPTLKADPVQMIQLFQNIISNSIKFNLETPTEVIVSSSLSGKNHHVIISDDGPGIRMEKPERLFEIFRTNHPDKDTEGIGMGLAICKKIVANHNGRIEIDPDFREGFRIHIYLPR